MHSGLFDSILPTTSVGAIAGTAGVLTGQGVDMAGWNGVAFVATQGLYSSGTVGTLVAFVSDTSNFAASTAIGTVAAGTTTGPNNSLILDIWRPGGRYVRPVYTPGGTVPAAIMAFQYARSSGVLPANGTAGAASTAGTAAGYTKIQAN